MLKRLRRRQRPLDRSPERRVADLERRVGHLEELLEGLQDALYRESVRRNSEATRMERRTAPGEMARALSEDARKRGLE
jgi:hypothetical protein